MKFSKLNAAISLSLLLGATSASALGVTVTADLLGATVPAPDASQNSFATELTAAGIDTLTTGPLSLVLSHAATLTFTGVAQESSYGSQFTAYGTSIDERLGGEIGSATNFLTGSLTGAGNQIFSKTFAAGNFEDVLSFASTMGNPNGPFTATFSPSTNGFGVFYKDEDNGNLTTFFLALDDSGGSPDDDNHEDYIVRVDVAAVPLPAAAWLLLGVSGALVAAKRRQHRKAA